MAVVDERAARPKGTSKAHEQRDVFISYAREDKAFVKRLHRRLTESGKRVYVDWEIPKWSEDWQEEIYRQIDASGTFVAVLSKDSVDSQYVALEFEHAVQEGKRMRGLRLERVRDERVPEAIGKPQWIDFRDAELFEQSFADLVEVLNTDVDWVQKHTRFEIGARDWSERGRDKTLLLGRSDLRDAEEWLGRQAGKEPAPTELQADFILASREAAAKRRQRLFGSVVFALAVAVGLAVFALVQRHQAIENEKTARSRELAATALAQLPRDPHLSVLLAAKAEEIAQTVQGTDALRQALMRSRLRVVMGEAGAWVRTAVFSSDGALIVTADSDRKARIRDAGTGTPVLELSHEKGVNDAAISTDGALVATAGADGTVRVWDAVTGTVLHELTGHKGPVTSVQFDPVAHLVLTLSEDQTGDSEARLWDGDAGSLLGVLRHGEKPGPVVFDLKKGIPRRRLFESLLPSSRVNFARFDHQGRRVVTTSWDGSVRVWEAKNGKLLADLAAHAGAAYTAAFNRKGDRIVTTGSDYSNRDDEHTARIWDWASGKQVGELGGHTYFVSWAEFSRDGKYVVTASEDVSARVWQLSTGKSIELIGHQEGVVTAAFNPAGTFVVTASDDETARIWETSVGRLQGTPGLLLADLAGHGGEVTSAVFNPHGDAVLTVSSDGTARLWEVGLVELRGHPGSVASASFSRDGRLVLTTGDDGSVGLWRATNGASLPTPQLGHPCEEVSCVASAQFSADGETIYVATDAGTAETWDAAAGTKRAEFDYRSPAERAEGSSKWRTPPAFSPSGDRLAVIPYEGFEPTPVADHPAKLVRILATSGGREVAVLRGHQNSVNTAVFSRDGLRIVTASEDKTARIWSAATGTTISVLRGHTAPLSNARFNSDGTLVVTASQDETARVWDVASGNELVRLRGHKREVLDASFSQDGQFVVTASSDGTARVWEAQSGLPVAVLTGHHFPVNSAAFSVDGERIVTASNDGFSLIYQCYACRGSRELLQLGRQARTTRNLSPTERARYLP